MPLLDDCQLSGKDRVIQNFQSKEGVETLERLHGLVRISNRQRLSG